MARAPSPQRRRREFLESSLGALLVLGCQRSSQPRAQPRESTMAAPTAATSSAPMPVLFVGHGSPLNAIEDNTWSRAFRALGEQLPRPRAVLCVSAHWYTSGTFLT